MSIPTDTEYFNQRGKAFKVEKNQWVSLRSKMISLHIKPEVGPCMVIQQTANKLIFKLQRKIKTKANPHNPQNRYGLVFKASSFGESELTTERIYAVKFWQTKDDEEFMDVFTFIFKEWDWMTKVKSDDWSCKLCTFMNKVNRLKCEICNHARPRRSSTGTAETRSSWSSTSYSYRNLVKANIKPICDHDLKRAVRSSSKLETLELKDEGWTCNLCTLVNKEDTNECQACGVFRRDDNYESLSPSHRSFQNLSDYIIDKNHNPVILFKTLDTICKQLCTGKEFGRTLWVKSEKVQNRLLSFDGGLEFLNLLGYQLDKKQETLNCLEKPHQLKLEEARTVINGALKNSKSWNSESSMFSNEYDQKTSEMDSPRLSLKLKRQHTEKILGYLQKNQPNDMDEWFDQEEDDESVSIHNILDEVLTTGSRDVLLLVYKTFCSSYRLLRVLRKRWEDTDPKARRESDSKARKEILIFCTYWARQYFEDMKTQPSFGVIFKRFIQQCTKVPDTQRLSYPLIRELEDLEQRYEEAIHIRETSIKLSSKINKDLTVLDFAPMNIAEVITMLDYDKFKQIKHRELLNQAWTKKDREEKAPTVLQMIAQFNTMCKWTQVCILSARSLVERKATMSWFIELTSALIKIKNFSSSFAIVSALTSNDIHCLKPAWEDILSKDQGTNDHNEHLRFFSISGNFKVLREHQRKVKPPAIPHIGLLLRDLVFIDDGLQLQDDESGNGNKVNYKKYTKLAKRIWDGFRRFQEKPLEFKRDDNIISWLNYNQAKVGLINDAFFENLSNQVKLADEEEKSKRGSGIFSKIFA